ncbi:MAG TPA: hypothetical protein VNI57_08165, partial [Candidatus Saccharimonadales bacterium]|nr:hypothetical protein [Candidatus Saccharimonadales bacterium]
AARPAEAFRVRVTGRDWKWEIRYPGADGVLGTEDDPLTFRNLHLPARSEISVDLRSGDYAYSLYLPEVEVMEAAIPGAPFDLRFRTGDPGVHELKGSQMCGFAHPELLGKMYVQSRSDLDGWMAALPRAGKAGAGPG